MLLARSYDDQDSKAKHCPAGLKRPQHGPEINKKVLKRRHLFQGPLPFRTRVENVSLLATRLSENWASSDETCSRRRTAPETSTSRNENLESSSNAWPDQ